MTTRYMFQLIRTIIRQRLQHAISSLVKSHLNVTYVLIPHFYFNYSKHNEIYMNKILRPQPVIRRRPVGCLFMNSRSRSASGQGYKMCVMSPFSALHFAFLLYGVRNARTCSDVQSVLLVSTMRSATKRFIKNVSQSIRG